MADQTMPDRPRLAVFCGAGGVGKTTIAASMACLSAKQGRHSVVFTVDPARRLADSLGVQMPGDALTEIPFQKRSGNNKGSFRAAMLNLDTVADELVLRYAPKREQAERIIDNPVFQTTVRQMSNTEDYLAWGKVYQLLTDVGMDDLFIDTAPVKNLMNFFTAPEHLLHLMDPGHIQRIKKPIRQFAQRTGKIRLGPLTIADSFLSRLAGRQWVDDAVRLVVALNELYDDFHLRVQHLQSIIRDPARTSIILVASPHATCLKETLHIARMLQHSNLPLKAVVFNKIAPPFEPDTVYRSGKQPADHDSDDIPGRYCNELKVFVNSYRTRVREETRMMMAFLGQFPAFIPNYRVPVMPSEITTVSELESLHPYVMECLHEM